MKLWEGWCGTSTSEARLELKFFFTGDLGDFFTCHVYHRISMYDITRKNCEDPLPYHPELQNERGQ